MLGKAQIMGAFQSLALIFMAAYAQATFIRLFIEQKFLICCIMDFMACKTNQIALNAQDNLLAAAPRFRYLHGASRPDINGVGISPEIRLTGFFGLFRMADLTQYQTGAGIAHRQQEAFIACSAMSHVTCLTDDFVGLFSAEPATGFYNVLRWMFNCHIERMVTLGGSTRIFSVAPEAQRRINVGFAFKCRIKRFAWREFRVRGMAS